jgi:uncharacterized protein (DUF2236 family)
MAGVADHSDYRSDPWGRLHRTGRFIGATTFGHTGTAERSIEIVRRIHTRVAGTAPDGRPYSAMDPHLLLWVHVTEVDSFLGAYERYGTHRLTDADRDRYVAEMAVIGRRLGAEDVPTDLASLEATIEMFRAECHYGDQAKDAIRFLLLPSPRTMPLPAIGPYGLISAAAVAMLQPWARSMLNLPLPPLVDPVAITPAATVLTRALGWMLSEGREADMQDRLLVD